MSGLRQHGGSWFSSNQHCALSSGWTGFKLHIVGVR
jgi:hypothetical protein